MKTFALWVVAFICTLRGNPKVPVLQPVESTPKEIAGLEFSIVTQTVWAPVSFPGGGDLVVQIRITNRGEKSICFPTLDTFSAVLTGPDGKSMKLAGNRDGTIITPVIVIAPGKRFCYPLGAKLSGSSETKSMELEFSDRTGGLSLTPLEPGDHSLVLELRPAPQDFVARGEYPAPLWSGKGTSAPVTFKVDIPAPPAGP
jgi:hypothetical protein